MTIIAVTMVKDEADVISATIAQLFNQGVDHIIAADNMSTDRTRSILERYDNLTIVDDDEPGYWQAEKMTRLARMAHDQGATWVLPFDADEIWYGIDGTIAERLAACEADVVMASGWDHIVTAPGDQPFSPWRRPQYQTLCKVAFRAGPLCELNMGNHDVRGAGPVRAGGVLEYRHFQYRSLAQMTRKLRNGKAAYEASDVHELHGTHWREGGALSDDELAAKWDALCAEDGLVFDPVPWTKP
jgi:hypothetical protein